MSVPVGGRTRSARLTEEGGTGARTSILPCSILLCMAADLSRYDDVLAFLTATPPAGARAAGGRGQRIRGHRRVGRALRPRRRGLVQRRRRDDVRRRAGAGCATSFPSTTCGSCPTRRGPTGGSASSTSSPTPATSSRPTRLLDLVVLTTPERLTMDTRRHGTPIVLHDPDGLLLLEDDDEAEMEAQRTQAVAQTAARRQTAAWLVERAIARDDLAEATAAAPALRGRAARPAAADPALPGPLRLRAALPAHRPARRVRGAGGSSCCPGRTWRSGPGQRSRGRTRSWLSSRSRSVTSRTGA